jgi:hypothetical protein
VGLFYSFASAQAMGSRTRTLGLARAAARLFAPPPGDCSAGRGQV